MTEALLRVAELLVVAVLSFGWAEGRRFLVKEGSGGEINRYLEAHPEREEDLMTVLSYFDPMNFANDVRCPTLVNLGLLGDVVPAPMVRAIAGDLGGRTRSSICPSATPSCPRSSCGTTSRRTGSAWR
ncbi:MAG TPA: acetylxylan esterase [Rubrobacter sp.]|jgi:cephalosporin-C deacetylase-like acetyl esterase|nr:acetylxylan esterase [Rubrobacter sp.]